MIEERYDDKSIVVSIESEHEKSTSVALPKGG
jgi:hypothetical protein